MNTKNRTTTQRIDTRKLTLGAMFAALSYVTVVIFRLAIIPAASYLNYDVKDVVSALGGLILGPGYGAMIAAVVALLEWVTISDSGWIGFIMNTISSCAFICPAALIYSRSKKLSSAVIGLVVSVVVLVIVMLLWNYILTPLYTPFVTRDMIVGMLLPVFLPFNAIKGSLNAAFVFLLYRPVIGMLRSAKLMPASTSAAKKTVPVLPIVGAVVVIVTCVLVILSMNGII